MKRARSTVGACRPLRGEDVTRLWMGALSGRGSHSGRRSHSGAPGATLRPAGRLGLAMMVAGVAMLSASSPASAFPAPMDTVAGAVTGAVAGARSVADVTQAAQSVRYITINYAGRCLGMTGTTPTWDACGAESRNQIWIATGSVPTGLNARGDIGLRNYQSTLVYQEQSYLQHGGSTDSTAPTLGKAKDDGLSWSWATNGVNNGSGNGEFTLFFRATCTIADADSRNEATFMLLDKGRPAAGTQSSPYLYKVSSTDSQTGNDDCRQEPRTAGLTTGQKFRWSDASATVDKDVVPVTSARASTVPGVAITGVRWQGPDRDTTSDLTPIARLPKGKSISVWVEATSTNAVKVVAGPLSVTPCAQGVAGKQLLWGKTQVLFKVASTPRCGLNITVTPAR